MAARDVRTRLLRRALRVGAPPLSDGLTDRLLTYFELLERWNQKINLTALQADDEAIDRLLLEPVLAARYLPPSTRTLIDIGSGGGSPAIPLALAAGGGVHLTMVEAKTRKSAFLREAVRLLELDADVETARYEELLAKPSLLERHDVLSIRAVRVETKVLNTLQAFIAPGGYMFLFRAGGMQRSLDILPPLEPETTVRLGDMLKSTLTVLHKRPGAGVPRGTLG